MKLRKKKNKSKTSNEISILQKGERALALENYTEAIKFFAIIRKDSSKYGRACKGRGAALLRMQRLSEALPFLQAAHMALPNDPDILVDGADVARLMGNLSVAEDTYKEARKRGADGFQLRFGEASIFQEQSKWLQATELWTELNNDFPGNPYVLHNLGKAWHELGETDRAVSFMTESFKISGETNTLATLALLAPHAKSCDHQDVKQVRVDLGKQLKLENDYPDNDSFPDNQRSVKENQKVNIGYVSAFFHRRNWMKPVWALLNNHNRDKFNLHLFADSPLDEINTEGGYDPHLKDKIYDTRKLENQDLAKLIDDCGIDVLVDLNSYSKMNRLSLWSSKPAPVTIGWFNLYATSGMPGIDWLVGDDVVIHPQEEEFYTEKIMRLKQSYLTFQVGYDTPDIEFPPEDQPFTFGCLGSAYKITPEVRAAWIKLLKETENTQLIVRNQVLSEYSHRKRFMKFFTKEGIDAGRIILLGATNHWDFIKTYGRIDLALDTFPYNGGTTTMESLWQGVPLVCFKGNRWISRTSVTILHSAELNDFIGENEKDYVEIAKKWSLPSQKEKLKKLRSEMRERLSRSKVCDGIGLAKDFEETVFEIIRSTEN